VTRDILVLVEPAFIWIAVAVILGVAELFTGTLVLAMVAAGAALAAAGAAFGAPLWIQAVLFAAGSAASIWGVRPFLKQALDTTEHSQSMGLKALQGKEAVVLEQIDADGGLVEISGDNWTAYPLEPDQVLEPGDRVTVVEIKGATVIVWRQT
jgi:membrane protein implicated in regulation of membrane protease activity